MALARQFASAKPQVAYLDDELDEQAKEAVEARLARDPEARAELDTLKQTWGMLDFLPRTSPSPDFTNRTLEKLSLEKVGMLSGSKSMPIAARRFPWVSVAGWAAAIVVALGLGYATPYLLAPAPPDPAADPDEKLIRYLPIIEKWRYYEFAEDRDFIEALAKPDLFGEESS